MEAMAYGDGTITRRPDGRLQVTVWSQGKPHYAQVPARLVAADPKAAKRKAKELQRQLIAQRDADLNPSAQTLADYLRSWLGGLRDAKHRRIRPRTLDHYAMIAEKHIIPTLGRTRLDKLTERHVQAWLDADPAAPRTVAHHRAVLRRALNVAVRQRIVSRNVAIPVELATVPEYSGKPLTFDEARRLLVASKDDRLHALWRLAIDTGLRSSELLGLGWDDVDTTTGTVTVTSQLQRRKGEWFRAETKAARTLARLSLGAPTVVALETHRKKQAAERQPGWKYWGLVFTTRDGNPLDQATVLRAFHAACDAAKIERRRFHDLRGSVATLMQELGIAEDVRMARLGHATRDMARHYAQPREGLDRSAADRLAEAIG